MDINAEISDMRVALASLEAKAKALEKPKQWAPKFKYWAPKCVPCSPISEAAMRTHNRLLAYVDEYGGGWEADWEDLQQEKYFVFYSHYHIDDEWCSDSTRGCNATGAVHMSQECAVGLVEKLNSGEVVL